MRPIGLASAFFLLMAVPATAQFANSAGLDAETRFDKPGVPAPGQTNNTDRLFAKLAAAGGMAEVDFGKLAAEKGQASAVKSFANRMVQDHGRANDNLAKVARSLNIALPTSLDPEHMASRDRLVKLDGHRFDLTYMEG